MGRATGHLAEGIKTPNHRKVHTHGSYKSRHKRPKGFREETKTRNESRKAHRGLGATAEGRGPSWTPAPAPPKPEPRAPCFKATRDPEFFLGEIPTDGLQLPRKGERGAGTPAPLREAWGIPRTQTRAPPRHQPCPELAPGRAGQSSLPGMPRAWELRHWGTQPESGMSSEETKPPRRRTGR